MANIPETQDIRKEEKSEDNKLAHSFSDPWVLIIIAHIWGIFLGILLAFASGFSAP